MARRSRDRWWCYLLQCADGSLYAGITNALDRRVARHNAGSASKYTRARRPVRLVWCEPARDRAAASRREAALKRLPRAAKQALARTGSARRRRRVVGEPRPRLRMQRVALVHAQAGGVESVTVVQRQQRRERRGVDLG
jgi:putative endonuclease